MLRDIRTNYTKAELNEDLISNNPFNLFSEWLKNAVESIENDPTAMVLTTIDADGNPDARVVLLKDLQIDGLVFYTNLKSKKAMQIEINNNVSALFFWAEHERQVRIKGKVTLIPEAEAVDYFLSRPYDSQVGAWSSPQSQVIANREELENNYNMYSELFKINKIEKPHHWGGYKIIPEYFEFWQGRSNRLHDRIEFCLKGNSWTKQRLAP